MTNEIFIKAFLKDDLLSDLFTYYKLNKTDDWKVWYDNFGYKIIFDKKIKIIKEISPQINDIWCKRQMSEFVGYSKIDYNNFEILYIDNDIRCFIDHNQVSIFNLSINKIRNLFSLLRK